MSYWTEDSYGVRGPEKEVARLLTDLIKAVGDKELVKEFNQLNAFCITCGYFTREYAETEKKRLPAERTLSSPAFFNFYAEIADINRPAADRLTFTVSCKWVSPNLKRVINRVYPTLEVYYEDFDESLYYNELEDYRLATNDHGGVFFKRYILKLYDSCGDEVVTLRSQDSGEFLQMIEHLTGNAPSELTEDALQRAVDGYLKAQGKGWTSSLLLMDYRYDSDEQKPWMMLTIARKLSAYLAENGYADGVVFDHRSYDNPEDIPHLILEKGRTDILGASLSGDGSTLTANVRDGDTVRDCTVILDYEAFGECPPAGDAADYETMLQEMNVYELLQDMYYETSSSWETGDFEADLLNL